MRWNEIQQIEMYFSQNKQIKNGLIPDKGNYKHFCEIWFSYVSERTKHWGDWNRWVDLFDHHWKWLNNCIGSLNYRSFIALILLVFFKSFYFNLWSILYLILIPLGISSTGYLTSRSITIFLEVIVGLSLIIGVIVLFAVLILIRLHIKLYLLGFTTFEYIQYLKDREDRILRLKENIITKEEFDQMEAEAKGHKMLRKSKVIKEVDDDRTIQRKDYKHNQYNVIF